MQAIVVDTDGVIICGHTRFKAAQKLGLEKLPVHVAKDLTPEQIKAYRIADYKTAELADWNYDLLPIELRNLQSDLNPRACGSVGFDHRLWVHRSAVTVEQRHRFAGFWNKCNIHYGRDDFLPMAEYGKSQYFSHKLKKNGILGLQSGDSAHGRPSHGLLHVVPLRLN